MAQVHDDWQESWGASELGRFACCCESGTSKSNAFCAKKSQDVEFCQQVVIVSSTWFGRAFCPFKARRAVAQSCPCRSLGTSPGPGKGGGCKPAARAQAWQRCAHASTGIILTLQNKRIAIRRVTKEGGSEKVIAHPSCARVMVAMFGPDPVESTHWAHSPYMEALKSHANMCKPTLRISTPLTSTRKCLQSFLLALQPLELVVLASLGRASHLHPEVVLDGCVEFLLPRCGFYAVLATGRGPSPEVQ